MSNNIPITKKSTSISVPVVPVIKTTVPTPPQSNIKAILPPRHINFEALPLNTKQKSFVDKNTKQQVFPVDQNSGKKE